MSRKRFSSLHGYLHHHLSEGDLDFPTPLSILLSTVLARSFTIGSMFVIAAYSLSLNAVLANGQASEKVAALGIVFLDYMSLHDLGRTITYFGSVRMAEPCHKYCSLHQCLEV